MISEFVLQLAYVNKIQIHWQVRILMWFVWGLHSSEKTSMILAKWVKLHLFQILCWPVLIILMNASH